MSANTQVELTELSQIVKLLIKDRTLVQDWILFHIGLDVYDPKVSQLKNAFLSGTLLPYELFTSILTSWIYEKGNAATMDSLCDTLRNIHRVSIAESLEREFGISRKPKTQSLWPLCFNVGRVNKHFVGRLKQLTQLQTWLENPSDQIILISGLGGIGKTELTTKFAHDLHRRGNTSVTWFEGETEETLYQSLLSLAKQVGIETEDVGGKSRKTTNFFQDLIKIVNSNELVTSWLVIFDNVDNLHSDLLTSLQLLCEIEKTRIILTSRNRSLAGKNISLMGLEEWETVEAVEFIKSSLQIDHDHEDDSVNELCKRLGNHALAMQQAIAYIVYQQWNSIKGKSYSVSDYIQEFDVGGRKTSQLLDHELSEVSHKFAKTTFVTWNITLAKIKETKGEVGPLACFILDRIAYLDPTGIQFEFLAQCLQPIEKSNKVVKCAVELLKVYCLVKVENEVIFIHRLVQEVIRLKLNSVGAEFSLLESLIEGIKEISQFSRSELAHVLSVWKYSSKYENLIRKYPHLPLIIFKRLRDFGLILEMFDFATLNYGRFDKVLGKENLSTLEMKHNLAFSLDLKGAWEDSLEIYKEVWEKQKEILGEEHKDTLTTAQSIAGILWRLNRLAGAKELLEKVWESWKKTIGENHPDAMRTKHNLALVFSKLGEVDDALGMFNEVLKWRKEKLGERHRQTLLTRHNIAYGCLLAQGKYLEAKEMLEDVWELSKAELGEEHPATIIFMHSLGKTLYNLPGQEKKALQILKQVLTLLTKIHGVNHPFTLEAEQLVQEIEDKIASTLQYV